MKHWRPDEGGEPIALGDSSVLEGGVADAAIRRGATPWWRSPRAQLALLAVATWWWLRDAAVSHDVVWQFWIARQMLGGWRLYTDILELNPPLWFWSAVPVQYAAELAGVPPVRLLIGAIVAGGAAGALLFDAVSGATDAARRRDMMVAIFLIGVVMPLYNLGQREPLALICAIPYVGLAAARREGRTVATSVALAIGLFAAYGFALKHYFIAVPALLELWILAGRRGAWRPLRLETAALLGCAIAYGASVPVFAPDFLRVMVPMVGLAYHGYEVQPFQMFDELPQLVWLAALGALLLYRPRRGEPSQSMSTAFLLAGIGFAVAYFAQRKGWHYHAVPVTGMLLLAVVARLAHAGEKRRPLGAVALALGALASWHLGAYRNMIRHDSDPLLRTVPRGEAVTFWASDPSWAWPMVEEYGLVWTSGYYAHWMLPAIASAEMVGPRSPALDALGREVRDRTYREMRCRPPAAIFSERGTPYYSVRPAGFDTTAFFLRDPRMAEFVERHYVRERSTRWFDVFRLRSAPRPAGASCLRTRPPSG
ncbi:hypothetical protein [Sphingomonas lenta]|uniref:Glycosyltransferase RgtA/B/C/D-like domain-containing protein n=1 Tax=Sphingomonas lenta TaxID=1141887 RepID=A0A2A2SHU3_9SPHN|nr:hypothetical protein [Sphingomonas lenta]PAX08802.1 hypothetical protein CKY28_05440 [Sphingomonas lenta]